MAYDKVVDTGALDGALTGIADAIRGKTGGTEKLTMEGMAAAIAGISAGGTAAEDALVSGTIIEYENPRVTTLGNALFMNNDTIEYASFPNTVGADGSHTFANCSSLRQVNLPKLESTAGNMFTQCYELGELRLPSLTSGVPMCYRCKKLEQADLGHIPEIKSSNAFQGCELLRAVVLRNESGVASLFAVSVFDGTPFAAGGDGGTVYVPAALIQEYRQATNWATLYAAGTCEFVAIEGSEYE